MARPFEDIAEFLDRRQVLIAFEIEELRAGRHHEWRVGHGADGGDVAQQFDVRRGGAEGVVADHACDRLTAELTVAGGVGMLVEAAAGDVAGVLEVLQQFFLGDVQHVELDVLAKIRAIDQQLQPAPGRLQLLELRLMQDDVHLLAQGAVDFGDHLVDPVLVDRLLVVTAVQYLADERGHALAGDRIAFLRGLDHGVGQKLIQQQGLLFGHQDLSGSTFHRHGWFSVLARKLRRVGRCSGVRRGFRRLQNQVQFAGQAFAGRFIAEQALQVLAKGRDIAHWAFEGDQGFAQFQ